MIVKFHGVNYGFKIIKSQNIKFKYINCIGYHKSILLSVKPIWAHKYDYNKSYNAAERMYNDLNYN